MKSVHCFGSEARHGRLHRARGRTCSSPAPTARCVPTARSARRRAITRATCSSARRCRSISPATARPRHSGASPASAARRTWVPTRAAGAMPDRAWLKAGGSSDADADSMPRGRKLVVQTGRDLPRAHGARVRRAARRVDSPRRMAWRLPPVMIYGDDVTHIVTEEGIANLLLCRDCRGARAGDPRRGRLHARSGRARDRAGRELARPRRHPACRRTCGSTRGRRRAICWRRARSRIWCLVWRSVSAAG